MISKDLDICGHIVTVKFYDADHINIICTPEVHAILHDMYETVGRSDFADMEFSEFVVKLLDVERLDNMASNI